VGGGKSRVLTKIALRCSSVFFFMAFPAAREAYSAAHLACTSGAALVTHLKPLLLPSPSNGGGQVIIELIHVMVHESRAFECAQGLGPRHGLAGWSFFENLFELRKVRTHRVFLGRHRSASAGTVYTDIAPAVSGSAIAEGVGAGLLNPVFFALFKLRKKLFSRAPFFFNGPGWNAR
jgi:hypothetical protein